jgi:FkbM family methyltransferase
MRAPLDFYDVLAQVKREYQLASLPDLKAPRILDIGANVGAFTWHAFERWPDAYVCAIEPHPATLLCLRGNFYQQPMSLIGGAVVHPRLTETVRLYEGLGSRCECSIRDDLRWPHVSQDYTMWLDVPTIDAEELAPCDVLKVDTEGCEVEILKGYRHLDEVKVLLVEPHAVGGDLEGQISLINTLAKSAGLKKIESKHVLRYVR